MKILFYLTRFPGFGGIESVTELIGGKLCDEGFELSILTHFTQSRSSALLERCEIFIMPDKKNWNSEANMDYAAKVMKCGHFDAIVYQDSYAPTHENVCCLSRKFNIPLYVFEHNIPSYRHISRKSIACSSLIKKCWRHLISYPLEDLQMKRRRKLLLKTCTKYIVLSDNYIQEMDIVLGATNYHGRNKIISIPNPIMIKNAPYLNKEKLILFVGRLEPVKRVDMMLDIWSMIEKKYPDWHFSIVGDGSEYNNLKEKAFHLGLKRVTFEGYSEPEVFYKKASIFWMTSLYEGWGMTLVEAMQHYCVPIAMDTYSSLSDIIEDKKTGLIVSDGNLNEFILQTSQLIDDEKKMSELAQAAHNSIYRFSVAFVIEKWKVLLNSIDK